MQRNISDNVLGQSLNPLKNSFGVESVDCSADFNNMLNKLDKLKILYDRESVDADMMRYIPGLSKIFYQGQLDGVKTKKAYAISTYTDKNILEFNINLAKNHYTNFSSTLICLPVKILKNTNENANLHDDMITVNNFFMHWLKEVDIKRYGDHIPVLPLNNILEVYKYSDTILKHIPDKSLKTFQSDLLYSNKKFVLTGNRD